MTSDQQHAPSATITTPTDREIHIERVFEAPRDRVFAVYTDPALIPEWWGPRGTTTIVDKMDVRTGGDWRFVARDSDGSETAFRGTYREVSPPERIVQTFEWEGMPGLHLPRDRRVRGSRRPYEGHHDVALLHDRGARRHARLGHGARAQRDVRAARRAARAARRGLTRRRWPVRRTGGTSGGPLLV